MVASLTRLSLVLCPLVAAALTVGVRPAGASVVSVQIGSLTTGGSGSVTPTLSSGSTSGTLLVAVVANGSSTSAPFSGRPTGSRRHRSSTAPSATSRSGNTSTIRAGSL